MTVESLKIQSNTDTLNIESICKKIDLGKANTGGIRLKPFYQREYKFKRKDESFLIESLLLGIPIPTIYLASDTSTFPHVSNVIDGQHRLRAIHRFCNEEYSLTGLEKLSDLNGKYFEDLDNELKNKLYFQTSLTVNYIHVQDDASLEQEIFIRYNRGTNPMSKQEIRHVVFRSEFNDWVIQTVEVIKEDEELSQVFNISKTRLADKTVHADLFLMFNILHFGLNPKHVGTPYYVDDIMLRARKMNPDDVKNFIEKSKGLFERMIIFVRQIRTLGIKHPFSKEVYSPEDKKRQFQASILMIMTGVINYMLQSNISVDNENIEQIMDAVKTGFKISNFYGATSATTNYELVSNAVNSIAKAMESEGLAA